MIATQKSKERNNWGKILGFRVGDKVRIHYDESRCYIPQHLRGLPFIGVIQQVVYNALEPDKQLYVVELDTGEGWACDGSDLELYDEET
jgi:hypothetical protein